MMMRHQQQQKGRRDLSSSFCWLHSALLLLLLLLGTSTLLLDDKKCWYGFVHGFSSSSSIDAIRRRRRRVVLHYYYPSTTTPTIPYVTARRRLFSQQQHTRYYYRHYSKEDDNNNEEEEEEEEDVTSIIVDEKSSSSSSSAVTTNNNIERRLHSYSYNLRSSSSSSSASSSSSSASSSSAAASCCYSLVHYLSSNETRNDLILILGDDDGLLNFGNTIIEVALAKAVVPAIRYASSIGNYRLIISLINASLAFATGGAAVGGGGEAQGAEDAAGAWACDNRTTANDVRTPIVPILQPRIFGEAIRGMAYGTSANIYKIKKVWNYLLLVEEESPSYLSSSVSAREVNAMLDALTTRKKMGSAIELYHERLLVHSSSNQQQVDSYSLTILLRALTNSVVTTAQEEEGPQQLLKNERLAAMKSLVPASCWQWNEALRLLDLALVSSSSSSGSGSTSQCSINNHVMSSLLELMDKVLLVSRSSSSSSSSSEGSIIASACLDFMTIDVGIVPDAVTCTHLLSNLGYSNAIDLFDKMKMSGDEALPRPNVYSYSAAIATCARYGQYDKATELLRELEQQQHEKDFDNSGADDDEGVEVNSSINNNIQVNTWVYNSVLQSLAASSSKSGGRMRRATTATATSKKARKQGRRKLQYATDILNRMVEHVKGDSAAASSLPPSTVAAPDTVTYNILLSILSDVGSVLGGENAVHYRDLMTMMESGGDGITASTSSNRQEDLDGSPKATSSAARDVVFRILDKMERDSVSRDVKTYRHAIQAVAASASLSTSVCWSEVLCLHNRARSDDNLQRLLLDGGGSVVEIELMNAVLSAASDLGLANEAFQFVISTISSIEGNDGRIKASNKANSEILTHLISVLGSADKTELVPLLLGALVDNHPACDEDNRSLQGALGLGNLNITSVLSFVHPPGIDHYATAIRVCLRNMDFQSASRVLQQMKDSGIETTPSIYRDVCRMYALAAIDDNNVMSLPIGDDEDESVTYAPVQRQKEMAANDRASNAFTIAESLVETPPLSLLAVVAKACASTGMFDEARQLLQRIHRAVLSRLDDNAMVRRQSSYYLASKPDDKDTINTLRRLKNLHRSLMRYCADTGNVTAALVFCDDLQSLSSLLEKKTMDEPVPMMQAPEWRSLLTAASKSGHWRVCLSTLQFLRPYVEATHPFSSSLTAHDHHHRDGSYSEEEEGRRLCKEYKRIAPSLNIALECLAVRSQYAWIVRAIDDWIVWSGRRPPKQAVLSAIRALSKRGRGPEINNLLMKCFEVPASPYNMVADGASYEVALAVGAISYLYHEGMYDAADTIYVTAVSKGIIPLNILKEEGQVTLDLHGMNVAVAHSAVRIAFQQGVQDDLVVPRNDSDMIIVTGRGRNSLLRMRPALRPEVQRMLVEEFYPPIGSSSIPNNMGALRVSSHDICSWLNNQRQAKGTRMLALAAVLKNLSSKVARVTSSVGVTGPPSPNNGSLTEDIEV